MNDDDQQTQREIQDRYKAVKAKLDGVRGVVDAVTKVAPRASSVPIAFDPDDYPLLS